MSSQSPIQPAAPPPEVTAALQRITRSAEFAREYTELLVEICRIDTTPNPDVSVMARAESAVFEILERELRRGALPGLTLERRAINLAISRHPAFSQLHFTKTPARPQGLPAETVYAGRANLLAFVPGTEPATAAGQNVALNAHIDVVAPYVPPRVGNGVVYGRGACDDKGPVVGMVLALRLFSRLLAARGMRPRKNVTAMFVIEEEPGGNGSLSLATDRELKAAYDTIVVGECTDNRIHPANRGAVWYKAELKARPADLLEMAAYAIEEMEKEGRAIKAESRHALFPQRPVQTCHGIIGKFGEHPSRICGRVTFTIGLPTGASASVEPLLRDCVDAGLAEHVGLYGDKSKVVDAVSGKPKVAQHYVWTRTESGVCVEVFGATGHMGSILENDGAITKMVAMVRALSASRAKIEAVAGGPLELRLDGADPRARLLTLEGGQGFVPTHKIEEVMRRMAAAASRGADRFLRRAGRKPAAAAVAVTYDKLHNAAFDGDPASPAMQAALAAAAACGMTQPQPVMGWTVSCDSRLFATEYPGMAVLTCGPGKLAHAHSDLEQMAVADGCRFVEFLVEYLWRQAVGG
jgi:acetylornithine deacetylase/succinyl-diaminopimelate desuccinylase-like protein